MATRNYRLSDSAMIQYSGVYRQHFLDHKADFVAFDPDFDLPFETDWQTAIDASVAIR